MVSSVVELSASTESAMKKTQAEENLTVWKKTANVFKWTFKVVYILCPPIPNMMIRKATFHPPKHSHYYFLIGGDKGRRRRILNAKSAQHYRNVTLCLPHLLQPKFKNSDVADQLLRIQVLLITTDNGDQLSSIYIKCEKSLRRNCLTPYVILFAQPNSSDIGSCMLTDPNLADIADFLQCDLVAFDYSGFGLSTGCPTEKNVYLNIEAVHRYMINELRIVNERIIVIGFSMGTAAVIHLAAKTQLGGLVLIAPFTSILRVIGRRPESQQTCCLDQFSSVDKAPLVNTRTLICHGMNDVIVSMNHGKVLYSRLPNTTRPLFLDKATHQGIYCERKMWDRVQKFILEELDAAKKWNQILENNDQS